MSEQKTNTPAVNSAVGADTGGDGALATSRAAPATTQPLTGWQKFKLVFKVVELRSAVLNINRRNTDRLCVTELFRIADFEHDARIHWFGIQEGGHARARNSAQGAG